MKKLFLSLALILGILTIPITSYATVQNTTNTVQYAGDNISTSFAFNNNVYLTTDLIVSEVTNSVVTPLTLNTNYTVALTAISGTTGAYTATINLAGGSQPAGALPVGTTLVITRSIPFTQLINISDYSPTPAATWNQALDRSSILSQQLYNYIQRSILQPITATSSINFPSANNGYCVGWNGTTLSNFTCGAGSSIPVPITNGYLAAITGANLVNTSSIYGTTAIATAQGGTGATANANAANGVVVLNGSSQLPAVSGVLLTNVNATTMSNVPYIKVTNTQTSGTGGGSTSAGSWNTLILNTKDSDTASISTLNSNSLALPAGTYQLSALAELSGLGNSTSQIRLYNSTASSVLLLGTSSDWGVGGSITTSYNTIRGQFTLAVPSSVLLQYTVGVALATNGQGIPADAGTEVYTIAEFTKIQ